MSNNGYKGFYYHYESILLIVMFVREKLFVLVAIIFFAALTAAQTPYYSLQVNPNPFYSPSNPFPGDEVVYSVKIEGKAASSGDTQDVNAEIIFNENLFEPIKSKDSLFIFLFSFEGNFP